MHLACVGEEGGNVDTGSTRQEGPVNPAPLRRFIVAPKLCRGRRVWAPSRAGRAVALEHGHPQQFMPFHNTQQTFHTSRTRHAPGQQAHFGRSVTMSTPPTAACQPLCAGAAPTCAHAPERFGVSPDPHPTTPSPFGEVCKQLQASHLLSTELRLPFDSETEGDPLTPPLHLHCPSSAPSSTWCEGACLAEHKFRTPRPFASCARLGLGS